MLNVCDPRQSRLVLLSKKMQKIWWSLWQGIERIGFIGLWLLLSFVLPCLLVAPLNAQSAATANDKATVPVLGQGPSLTFCVKALPRTANPQQSLQPEVINVISRLIYDTLIEIDTETGLPVPALAESWEISDNGRVYTFGLRQDVRFQEQVVASRFQPTRLLTADDVLYTFRRQARVNHPYHWVGQGRYPYFTGMQLDWNLLAVDKLDPYTVQFTLRNPDAGFIYDLAMDFAVIQSEQYSEAMLHRQHMEIVDQVPVGTGAYQWAEKVDSQTLTLYANPLYWKGDLDYQKITIKAIPDTAERSNAYLRGDCHLLAPVEGEALGDSMDLLGDKFPHQPKMELLYLSFSTQHSVFSDTNARRAVNEIINKRSLALAGLGRAAITSQELIPLAHWLFADDKPDPIRFSGSDQERADKAYRSLQQTFANKPLRVLVSNKSRPYLLNPISAGEVVVDQLNAAGIFSTLEVLPHNEFLHRTQYGIYDIALIGWSGENGDLDNFLYPILSCTQVKGNNRSQWCDTDVERWLKEGRLETDFAARAQIYRRILRRVANQIPIIPIAHTAQYLPRRAELRAVNLDIRGGLRWHWFVFSPFLIEEPTVVEPVVEVAIPEVTIEELRTLE